MTEEAVTKAILQWLEETGTGRKFHLTSDASDKTRGIIIPDIIAHRETRLLVLENKSVDTLSDYDKIKYLAGSPDFKTQLLQAYPELDIEQITLGIGYGGAPRHLPHAASSHIDVILGVSDKVSDMPVCQVIFGKL